MAKSKNNKKGRNHKKKLKIFKEKMSHRKNQMQKMQKLMIEQFQLQQEHSKREKIIETILEARPEMCKKSDEGNYIINNDIVDSNDNILVWKADGNPLLAGLEPLENYPLYTEELVNAYLTNIHKRKQNEKNMSTLETREVLDLTSELQGGDETTDTSFEVIEDPSYKEDKK